MASDSNSSPDSPPPSQWPVSLEHLLNSSTGKNLFLDYLRNEDEGLSVPMLFLLAVEGLHGVAEESTDEEDQRMVSSIKLIYEELIPSVTCLSQNVKESIQQKIVSPTESIYDAAAEEVREHLSQNLYPNFLKSEFYLAAINHEYGGASSAPPGPSLAEGGNGRQVRFTELLSVTKPGTSISSDEVHDLQTVHEEEVLSLKRSKPFELTEKILLSTQWERAKKGTGNGPQNPYHAQYSSYNPVSRQDSEMQSQSSGCTDESSGQRRYRARREIHIDNLPPVATHNPVPKREGYTKYTMAEADPAAFAKELTQKLKKVKAKLLEERVSELGRHARHQHPLQEDSIVVSPHSRQSNQIRPDRQILFGPGIDNKTLMRKLEESSHAENFREEPEQEGQSILDQHVRRVWKDSTTPELSRSPRNEAITIDSRKARRGHSHGASTAPHAATTALIKGKSMQTLDSGIGGDKEHRSYKVRPPPPIPRWANEQFIDSGMSDAGRSSTFDLGPTSSTDRSKFGDPSRRVPPIPSQPVPHRRHSPPSEDTVSVIVHYEVEHANTFRIKIPKNKLTLGVLKSKVPKKGNWKYLFKLVDADDRNKLINYELKRDEEILPMFREECVIVILKSIHPPPEMSNVV